jgi:D-methionine transport system substrate-binding protein
VAIANDPINSGRGLQLLAKAGLITLKPGVGYKATEEDIVANPKKIKILQVEAVQLVRAYDDADLVQGYPAYIRLAKTFDAGSALLFDGLDHKEYVIQFVIQPKAKRPAPDQVRRHLPALASRARRPGQSPRQALPSRLGELT